MNYNHQTLSSKATLPQYCRNIKREHSSFLISRQYCRNIRNDIKMSSEYSNIAAISACYLGICGKFSSLAKLFAPAHHSDWLSCFFFPFYLFFLLIPQKMPSLSNSISIESTSDFFYWTIDCLARGVSLYSDV